MTLTHHFVFNVQVHVRGEFRGTHCEYGLITPGTELVTRDRVYDHVFASVAAQVALRYEVPEAEVSLSPILFVLEPNELR